MTQLNFAIVRGNQAYNAYSEQQHLSTYMATILYALLVKEKITQRELVETSDLPKQSINKGIHILQQKNYLRLVPSKKDRRVKICELTPQGKIFAHAKMDHLFDLENEVAKEMGLEKMKELIYLNKEWSDRLWSLLKRKE